MKKLLFLLAIGLAAACGEKSEVEAESVSAEPRVLELSQAQIKAGNFELGMAQSQVFSDGISCTGNTEVAPEFLAEISPVYGGYVAETHLLSGQKVKKGQTLFYLEAPFYIELQEQYLKANARYQWLKQDYERLSNLAEKEAIADKEWQESESKFLEAEAEWQALRKKLALVNISAEQLTASRLQSRVAVKAPINGIISEVHLSKGKYLEAGQLALKIIDNSQLHLGIQVFEEDLKKIAIDQALKFRLQGSEEWYDAKIKLINPALNAAKGTANLHAEISTQQDIPQLQPGMYVEALIKTQEESFLALPIEALLEEGDQFFVYETNSEAETVKLNKVEVQLGQRNSHYFSAPQIKKETRYLIRGAFRLATD